MLVMNDTSMHKIPKIQKDVEMSETKVTMTLENLSRYLKPLDVLISKPFKEEIKRCTISIVLKNTNIKVPENK